MADNIKKLFEEKTEETKRHFDVVAERIEHKIDILVEGFEVHTEQLNRLQEVPAKLDKIDDRLLAIETARESVNLPEVTILENKGR